MKNLLKILFCCTIILISVSYYETNNVFGEEQIKISFNKEKLLIFNDSEKLKIHLQSINLENKNLLMMSSGNFNKLDFNEI